MKSPQIEVESSRVELPSVSVVIPCYDEVKTIESLVRLVLSESLVQEIIIVDDGSRDGTWNVLESLVSRNSRVQAFRHKENRGKGAALRTAFAKVTGSITIIQDADLEYDPCEYTKLLEPILSGRADVVYGTRFLGGGPHRVSYFWHSIGNKFLTTLSNLCTNLNLTDMEVGFKVFRSEVIQKITLYENGFGFEPEVTAKIAKINGIRVYEVPISYFGRTYKEGKKIDWRDGIAAIWFIFKYNFFGVGNRRVVTVDGRASPCDNERDAQERREEGHHGCVEDSV